MRLRVLADIPESPLSDICQHPPPRLPIGRLKRSKIKKPPLAVKKTGCSPEQKELLWEAPPQQPEAPPQPSPREGTEKLKHTIKLKVDDGEIAVLPFIICLF